MPSDREDHCGDGRPAAAPPTGRWPAWPHALCLWGDCSPRAPGNTSPWASGTQGWASQKASWTFLSAAPGRALLPQTLSPASPSSPPSGVWWTGRSENQRQKGASLVWGAGVGGAGWQGRGTAGEVPSSLGRMVACGQSLTPNPRPGVLGGSPAVLAGGRPTAPVGIQTQASKPCRGRPTLAVPSPLFGTEWGGGRQRGLCLLV